MARHAGLNLARTCGAWQSCPPADRRTLFHPKDGREVRAALHGRRRPRRRQRVCRSEIIGTSVSGLSSVDTKTVLVTKLESRSNSRARTVVTTAAGMDAS